MYGCVDHQYIEFSRISSDVPKSDFDQKLLSKLADALLNTGISINRMVVRRTKESRDSTYGEYKVVEGHFLFHALTIAFERDTKKHMATGFGSPHICVLEIPR